VPRFRFNAVKSLDLITIRVKKIFFPILLSPGESYLLQSK
jgi:hypothetical protein